MLKQTLSLSYSRSRSLSIILYMILCIYDINKVWVCVHLCSPPDAPAPGSEEQNAPPAQPATTDAAAPNVSIRFYVGHQTYTPDTIWVTKSKHHHTMWVTICKHQIQCEAPNVNNQSDTNNVGHKSKHSNGYKKYGSPNVNIQSDASNVGYKCKHSNRYQICTSNQILVMLSPNLSIQSDASDVGHKCKQTDTNSMGHNVSIHSDVSYVGHHMWISNQMQVM